MANNRVKINCDIDADIGQAKKAISDLQRSIEKLSKAQINTNYLDKGINNAVAAAKELEHHLNAALNQNTGKLNLNAFTSSLEQSNISAKDLMQTLLQGGSAGQQTFASLANAIAQSEVPLRRANKTLQDFATTLKNTVKWEISSTMVHGLESALSGAVSYAKNLNTSLTNIRIVTGQSVDDMARFAKEANVAAKALSTTTKSYADASLIYYQQGDSQELAAKKAAITIKAANSSFETSAKEMSEYLTSVWNSYQVGADELEHYVDIMANLGAKTATSLEEIATSMQKVAATANTVGVSMEQVSSIIATVSSVTRESAESIGTSYKTIFARIGDLKLGGVDEDGVGLGQVSSQLDAIGVKILDESGNLREMGDIIMDLGTKWQTMNQAQKTAVAQVVAGKRQYTQLMALFENWDMFQGNMNIAENSEGALQDMADIYAESWEAASARVQASMEAIYGQVLNDEFIIKLTDGFASITDGISKMISGFGGLSGVLLHTGAIGTKVFQKQIASSIDQAKDSVTTFFSQFKNNSAKDAISKLFHGDVKSVEAIKFTENTNKWKQDLEMASRQAKISGESDIKVRENAEVILTLKQSLLDAENQLSAAQMQRAQQELAYLSKEQDGLVQILRQKEERAKVEKQYAAQARVAISQADPNQDKNQYADLATQSDKAFENINQKYEDIGVITNALDGLKSGVYDVDKAFELLNQEIQDDDNRIELQRIKESIEGLNDSAALEQLQKEFYKLSHTIQQSAAKDLADFKKALEHAFEGNQDILDKIDKIFDQTVENAREKGEDAGEAYARGLKVGALRSDFEQLITEKLDPKKLESFGGKVSQVANAALDLSSFVYAAGNAVSVLGDESSTAGEKMSALIGIISGVGEAVTGLGALANAFGPWGAIIGAAVTAGAAFFTVKDEIEKNQREQYEKEFEVTSSRSSDRVSKVAEEEKELQTLLSTYNDLYSRYQAGEDVQNELSASASALADAYGITGAAVASVTGNFENFNDEVIKTLDLSKELQDAKIAKGLAANTLQMHQVDKNNLQQDFSSLLNPEEVAKGIQTAAETATIGDIQSKIFAQNKNLTLTDLIATGTDARGQMVSGSQLEKILSLDPSGFIEFITDIAEDVKGIQLTEGWVNPNGLKSVSYGKKQQYDQDGNRIYNQDEIAGFLSANQNIIGSNTLEDYLEIYLENYLMSANLNPEDLVQAWEVAADAFNTAIEPEAFSSILKTEDQDFTKLFSNNKLMWDNDASINDKIQNFEELQALEEHLIELMSSETLGENTKNTVSNLLKEVQVITQDETLSKATADYQQAAMSESIFNNAKSLIDQTIGKGVADVSLEDYQKIWNQIDAEVSKNAETYKLDVNADDYEQAKNKVIAGIINDYTILDDWTNVVLSLAETFTDSDDYKKASEYVKNLKPEEITGDLLEALSLDIGRFGEAGKYTEAVKASQGAKQDKIDAQQYYTKASQVASTYKSGMDLEDATAIYDTFFSEGAQELEGYTKDWDEFLKLDSDARKAYLEGMSEAALKAAKEKANASLTKYTEEQTTFNDQYGAMLGDTSLTTLISDFTLDENKQLKYIGKDVAREEDLLTVFTKKASEYGYEDINALYQGYQGIIKQNEEIRQKINATTNELKGYQLLDEVGDRAIDKITRLGNIVSKLPEDSKEFKKLMDQLPDKVTELDLINMSELKRAELILNNLDKPLQENFTDEKTGKVDWGEYYKALNGWEQANKSAATVIINNANEAFAQIENRMNAARTEAEKTKTIAESLSGAIKTGELTETQKLGMSQTLIDDWDKASNATERAAIAAQQWANYGTKITNAGKEAADAYVAAGIALDNTIKSAKANNVTDLLTFNFSNKETGKTDFGKFIQNVVTDPSLQAIWNKGFENLISHTDISNMSDLGILEAVKAEIQKTGKVTQTEFDQMLAGVKDSIISMYSTLGEQEASLAQQVVNEWESAFKQIANLRRSIIMGDDIGSDLTASLQDYVKYANAYTGQGSLAQAYKSGNLTANQMSLGSSEGLTEKLLASMGLANDKWEVYKGDDGFLYQKQTKDYYDLFDSKNGETVLKGIDALAAQFNISKIDKDEVTYEKAVREAVAPFIRNLLSQSDLDATTVDAKVNEFLNGSITAEETINQAANKMLNLAGEYATLLDSNQQLAEADAKFKATQEEQTKIQTEAQNYANVTESIMALKPEDRNVGKIAEVLSNAGISSTDYISSMQQKGFNVSSIDDITNLSYEQLEQYENLMQQDAAEAGKKIVEAATLFKSIVTGEEGSIVGTNGETGLGFGEDSVAGKTAEEYLKEATNSYNSSLDAYNADTSIDLSSQVDSALTSAKTQFESVNQLYDLKQGTNEWYQGLDEVSSAYQGIGEAQEIINKLYDGTINLKEANEQLCSITMKTGDKIEDMTDAQYDQWKQMLRNNKVNIKGYKTLEDYFKECDKGRAITQKMTKSTKKFVDEMDDAGSEANKMIKELENFEDLDMDGIMDPEETGWDELMDTIVPEEFQGITDQLLSVWTQFGGDWNAALAAGFDTATNTFNAETQQLLTAMGLSQEQILSMQDQIKMAIQNGAAMGEIDFLSMIAGMDVNNIPFDTMIAKLNTAMQQIYAAAAAMGVPLTPPWEDLPTLASKGVGAHGGGGGGNNASTKPSGGSGGGGSKDKKKEKKDLIRYKDEVERYHVQNETLERISENLDEIDKLKERAYGKDHIAQIDAETDALNKQLLAQQDLHDEALKWMAADKADLAKYGAEYDENGTIVNYEKVMERIIDEYNAAIERYNNSEQGEGDKLALEAAEQRFEDAKKAIENYEEALGIANDSANEMLEIQNKMSELEVEKITYELELKMEMNERDLEILEYYQDKYSEELENQDKLFNTFIQSAAEYEDNLAQLGKAYEDLSRQYAAGLINEADYAEAVTELQEEIVDNLSSLQEIQSELVEVYSQTLELAREEIERTTDAIDHSNEALQSFMDITRLTGNDAEYKKIGKFYDQMYANNLTKIEVQKAHLDSLLEEEKRFQEKIRNGQQLTELEKAEYAALSEQIQETRDTLLSSVVESLEVVRESYENTINSIANDLDNFMAGAAGSMEYLQEQYGYFQEEQERYVSTTKELYEVSKLNREIEGTLATTTSSAAKEALKALQEKINKQSELNELTEYDIEMNQLQYQLLLARIKLEESQNAKDTVRLTRDENGNYAYRYTANQDKIDEAAQHYEDVLQQINDTTVQRTSEIEQQLLNTMSNYKEKFQEIATDYSLTEEERLMRLEELNNQFSETMRYLQEQNNIVTDNLTANQEAIAGHYGITMSEITASTAGNVNDTIQSMIDKTEEYIAAMNNAIFGEEGAQSAWQKYLAQLGDIEGSADVAYDSLLGNAQEMGEMNGFAAEEALEVIQTLRDTLDPLEALSSAWDAHNAILEATISNYENLAQVIQGVLSAIGEIPNGGSTNVDGAHRYANGGLVDYTGLAWVDGTASDPEMMLNPGDTQNILKATSMVKSLDSGFIGSLVESVKSAAAAMLHMFGGAYHAITNVHTANGNALDQNVHITAEFPNVQNHTEIEEAFDNLINQAAQFAHRKN